MNKLIRFILIVFFIAIAFSTPMAMADSFETRAKDHLQQAAKKVVEDDSAKEQFGKSPNGEKMLDDAKSKAKENLTELANTDVEDLPNSKKLFLKNLAGE